VTFELFASLLKEEMSGLKAKLDKGFDAKLLDRAAGLLETLVKPKTFTEFLTLPGYEQLA